MGTGVKSGFLKWVSRLAFVPAVFCAFAGHSMAANPPLSAVITYVSESAAVLEWDTNLNKTTTYYQVDVDVSNSFPSPTQYEGQYNGSIAIGSLNSNTIYYTRIRAKNDDGSYTSYSNIASSTTLAPQIDSAQVSYSSSVAVASWTPLSGQCNGYTLSVSTNIGFGPPVIRQTTSDDSAASLTVTGLDPNTKYYYTVATINRTGATNEISAASFTTYTSTVTGTGVQSVYLSSASVNWTAFPVTPSSAAAQGYVLQASTDSAFNGTIVSSATSSGSLNHLAVSGILQNTTYYFRVGAVNSEGVVNYVSALSVSSATIAIPVDILTVTSTSTDSAVIVRWSALQPSPQYLSCSGYRLEASTDTFSSTALVFSSSSVTSDTSQLTVSGLLPNRTYNLRLATLSINGTLNYITLPAIKTALSEGLPYVNIVSTGTTSVTLGWLAQDCDGYVAEASLYEDFSIIAKSVSTTNPAATSLTITGLNANTRYYLRAGKLYDGTPVYTLATPRQTSTLSLPVSGQSFNAVYNTSMTVTWTALPDTPQESTAEGYVVQMSTWPDLSFVTASSVTYNMALNTLTLSKDYTGADLVANTSYYAMVGTYNWDYTPNFATISGNVVTLVNTPVEQAYNPVHSNDLQVNWLANGNPADTKYIVDISSRSDFSSGVQTAETTSIYHVFSGLISNTAYYVKLRAVNRIGVSGYTVNFSSITMAGSQPTALDFNVYVTSATANWGANGNPNDTVYRVELSTDASFGSLTAYALVTTTACTFSSITANMTYYGRVNAQSKSGTPTSWTSLGSILTFPQTPGDMIPVTENFSDIGLDKIIIHWNTLANSAATTYHVDLSSMTDFSVISGSGTVSASKVTFTGLIQDTTYYGRVNAIGSTGITSDYKSLGSTMTIVASTVEVSYDKDTTLNLAASFGNISLYIPAYSFPHSVAVGMTRNLNPPSGSSAAATLLATNVGVSIVVSPQSQPLKKLQIIIPYKPEQMTNFDRDKLIVAYFDTASNVWVPLPSTSDKTNNKVTGTVTHLSNFQIMQVVTPASKSEVKIFPNPYNPSRQQYVQFTNMPPNETIRIYTFLGEKVTEFSADQNGTATWDAVNSYGNKVASGVYIVLIGKGSPTIKKLAIQR